MEYLGALGRLVGMRCASTERVEAEPRYSVTTTVEGRRSAQVAPTSARTWDVTWGARRAPEVAKLSAFTAGAWGAGPWHWIPVQAQHGNLLTPREASLLEHVNITGSWSQAGPVLDADGGWAARSLSSALSGSYAQLFNGIPVLPGGEVTWSADVQGTEGPAFALGFSDESGAAISSVYDEAVASASMTRVSMTATVPEGAASVHVGVRPSVTRLVRPQVTWTDGPVPYSAGHGCRMAIVDGLSEDLIVANRFGTYSSAGFTVMEVG